MSESSALPKGWCWAPLGEIANIKLGKMLSRKAFEPHLRQLPYLRNENVRWFSIDTSDVKTMGFGAEDLEKYRLQVGDLLVCEGGEPGRCAVVTRQTADFMFQKALHRVRPIAAVIDTRLLQYAFRHFISSGSVIERRSETTIQHLPLEKMRRTPMLLPPTNEQRRIVAKIEELFSDLDAGVAALERVKANLKRYRAAVLKAAVEGKLTAQWRTKHPNTEPASKLLERILAERRKKWEADQLARFAAAGKPPPKNWRDKYQEPTAPDTSSLPSVPKGWCWATVAALLMAPLCNGISVKGANEPPGVPALRLNAMSESGFDYSCVRYIPISEEVANDLAVVADDFFVSRGNGSLPLVGRGTLAQEPPHRVVFPDTMMRARLADAVVRSRWIPSIWPSRFIRRQVEKMVKTTAGIWKIAQPQVETITVPLPPFAEQDAIRERLEARLTTVSAIEQALERAETRAARLRQSILKRAFEGKLVPQDPKDEPASVLLERIKADRSKGHGDTKAQGRSKRNPRCGVESASAGR